MYLLQLPFYCNAFFLQMKYKKASKYLRPDVDAVIDMRISGSSASLCLL